MLYSCARVTAVCVKGLTISKSVFVCSCVGPCLSVFVSLTLCLSVCLCKDLRGNPRIMGLIVDDELRMENISRLWDDFNRALHEKSATINDAMSRLYVLHLSSLARCIQPNS